MAVEILIEVLIAPLLWAFIERCFRMLVSPKGAEVSLQPPSPFEWWVSYLGRRIGWRTVQLFAFSFLVFLLYSLAYAPCPPWGCPGFWCGTTP